MQTQRDAMRTRETDSGHDSFAFDATCAALGDSENRNREWTLRAHVVVRCSESGCREGRTNGNENCVSWSVGQPGNYVQRNCKDREINELQPLSHDSQLRTPTHLV